MSYPVGITTRPVTIGSSSGLLDGTGYRIKVIFKAVLPGGAADMLIWDATGQQLPNAPVTVTGDIGTELTHPLVVTDQAGMRSLKLNALIDVSGGGYSHRYTADVQIIDASGRPVYAYTLDPFIVPTGDGTPIDLDKMLTVGSTAGTVVQIPDTWSPIVAAAQAAADAAAENVSTAIDTYASELTPASLPYGRRVMFLGDSITAGTGAANATFGYVSMAARKAGSESVGLIRRGYPGERSDQILARLAGLLDADTPDAVHIQVGTNDAAQAVPAATVVANIAQMRDLCAARRIPVTVGTVPPRGATQDAAIHTATRAINHHIYRWATDHAVPCADVWGALVDPATGDLLAAYDSGDGVHPSNAGHLAMGRAVAPVVARITRSPWPVVAAFGGLCTDPLNTLTSPDPWSTGGWIALAGSTPTPSMTFTDPADGDGLTAGRWLTLTADNTSGSGTMSRTVAKNIDMTGLVAGDTLVAFCRIKTSGDTTMSVRWLRSTTTVSLPVDSFQDGIPLSGHITAYTLTADDIAAGSSFRFGFSISAPIGSAGTANVGQVQVYNAATMQIVGMY